MMWGYHYGLFGMGLGLVGWIFAVIWWIVVISCFVMLIRWLVGHSDHASSMGMHRPTPLDILKERYAKGEIDKKEFDERKKDL